MTGMGFRHRGLLLGRRLFLILGLPFLVGHAVDDLPRFRVGQPDALRLGFLAIPAAEAIPAKAGEVHQVDVLHVGSLAQMLNQAAECGGFQFGGGGGVGFGSGMVFLLSSRLSWCRWSRLSIRFRRVQREMASHDLGRRASPRWLCAACSMPPSPPPIRGRCWRRTCLQNPRGGRCIVIGGGKSAAVMAAALEDAWPDVALEGTVVTRYDHAVPTRRIEVIEASHPVPDANSERGARRLLERVQGLTPHDLVIALMSGGASSLLAAPAPGLTLNDKQAINRALLASGANIGEMNIGTKAPVRDQRWAAGGSGGARQGGDFGDQRRAGRRSGRHRFRSDRP